MKQSCVKKNRMETIMRITWALLPLGLLLHCTDANPKQQPSSSSYIASNTTTITAGVTATPSPISTQVTSVVSNTATLSPISTQVTSVVSNTATLSPISTQVTSVVSNTATLSPISTQVTSVVSNTATLSPISTQVTSVVSNTATLSPISTHKVTSVVSNTATLSPISTHKVTSVVSNTARITTASITPGTSIVTAVGTAGTGASGSSGTLTQTTPDTTEVTEVSTTTSAGPTPWSASSFPSHPPSTSSRVGSGSSLATTTTSTQGWMVSTTTAETTTPPKSFTFVKSQNGENYERKDLEELCRQLMSQMHDANCTLTVRENNGHTTFDSVVMTGKVDNSVVQQYYEEITRKPSDNMTLIAILASCGALLAMIVGFAIYASYHRKSYRKNLQQHLTEELQTVEDGYHDNPTLEVMEVQPEMQEKKVALYGEFNDSWIVPIDSLLKEDMPDEEDTHL
ncbi:podocalyxin isoform X2 [Oncorhynchus tshawytscha]|uniref:podocalyxin isoform X2 n=1 Tax=Oncorhynchus tshawytscha TaxID=74940 RepID=UPI001C3C1CB3|nr:podocalyxin isoform X2 [Oncorhynchus tshawytscha]